MKNSFTQRSTQRHQKKAQLNEQFAMNKQTCILLVWNKLEEHWSYGYQLRKEQHLKWQLLSIFIIIVIIN